MCLVTDIFQVTMVQSWGRGAAMTKLGIFAATILAAAGACCGVSAANAAPKTCTGLWDFIETDCQLTWYGITLYGAIDAGFTYQTHGAPLDTRSPPGSAYIVQRYSRSSSRWDVAPNGLQNSFIGIKGTEPIGGNTSVVFALDAGFDPIHSDPPVDRDRPMPTPALPRTSKPRGRIPAGPASFTTATVGSVSVPRAMAR